MSPATVAELMTAEVRSVSTLDVIDNVRAVLHESSISAVPVLDPDGRLAGLITSNDLVEDWNPDDLASSIMSDEVVTTETTTSAIEAASTMLVHRVHHLVVTDGDGEVTGIVSSWDLLRALADFAERTATPTIPDRHAPKVGDDIVIRGHAIGSHERRGRIVEIRGAEGGPPYMVQWRDDPHDEPHAVMFFPGPDADVEPAG